jgi:hypothetical protein
VLEALALYSGRRRAKSLGGGEVALGVEILVLLVLTDAQLGGDVLFSASSEAEVLLLEPFPSLARFAQYFSTVSFILEVVSGPRSGPPLSTRPFVGDVVAQVCEDLRSFFLPCAALMEAPS